MGENRLLTHFCAVGKKRNQGFVVHMIETVASGHCAPTGALEVRKTEGKRGEPSKSFYANHLTEELRAWESRSRIFPSSD